MFVLYLLVITPGLGRARVLFANKNEGPDERSTFVSVFCLKTPALAGFGTSMVLSTIILPGNYPLITLISEFKKIVSQDQEYATDSDYDNTCNIY